MTIELDGISIDISQAEDFFVGDGAGKLQRIDSNNLDNPTKITLNGVNLAVQPKEELIAYKEILGRSVDKADLAAII